MPIYRSYRLSRSFAQLKRILAAVITIGGVPPIRGIPRVPRTKCPPKIAHGWIERALSTEGYYIGRGRRKRKRRGEGRRIGLIFAESGDVNEGSGTCPTMREKFDSL